MRLFPGLPPRLLEAIRHTVRALFSEAVFQECLHDELEAYPYSQESARAVLTAPTLPHLRWFSGRLGMAVVPSLYDARRCALSIAGLRQGGPIPTRNPSTCTDQVSEYFVFLYLFGPDYPIMVISFFLNVRTSRLVLAPSPDPAPLSICSQPRRANPAKCSRISTRRGVTTSFSNPGLRHRLVQSLAHRLVSCSSPCWNDW